MRRNRAPKREIHPDVRHNSIKVQSFINRVMKDGKKSLATRVVYQALDIMQERAGQDGLELFDKAIENASPVMEVKPRRIGGATYQVPMEVPPPRRFALATRWILAAARGRSGKSFPELLADELLDAANNTGSAVRRREESHRMAKANRAFSHFQV
ncbi:MAG: 30S ribosomal protein S7 [Anaerolineae bacterium]|mgnify:CR=1 FL=1|jgi:small subunit ribosomal protein S7|nr:30S ribosomal protein S7 [Anaerolineae bacterium]MBL6966112.1 30S ribosomal protein S7 [Anaerolineales bacterium]MBT3391823.1 30S ribosomal protein S7 [Chloroflexota bacterium]